MEGGAKEFEMNVVSDLEFSGLDNTYIANSDITQVKLLCVETGKTICRDCRTDRPVSVFDRLQGKTKYCGRAGFSKRMFSSLTRRIGASTKATFWGYSVEQDTKMLAKYDVDIEITDLQELMRLNPDYEESLAVGCASMEAAYYLLTGEVPHLRSHYEEKEIELIARIYQEVQKFDPEKQNKHLTMMPWGHCAGMPISDYVASYRRAADGYRYNNEDLLAKSLTRAIPAHSGRGWNGGQWDGDGDEVDDWDDDEDDY